jgi:hypothetical protein
LIRVAAQPRSALVWLGYVTFAALLLALLGYGLTEIPRGIVTDLNEGTPLQLLALAIAMYLGSHLLRALRLAILVGNPRVSVRRIGQVHLTTAAASLLLPFKLGEVFRIAELGHLLADVGFSVTVVWLERAFDFAVLTLVIGVIVVAVPEYIPGIRMLLAITVLFVAGTAMVFTVVAEGLPTLSLFVLRRYDGPRAVRVLRGLQWLREALALGPRMIVGKVATLFILSVAIWALELGALATTMPPASRAIELLGQLAVYLSSGSLQGLNLDVTAPYWRFALVQMAALIPVGSLCAIIYAPERFGLRRGHAWGRI